MNSYGLLFTYTSKCIKTLQRQLKKRDIVIIEKKKIVDGEVREEKSKGTGRITAPHAMYQVIMIKKLSIFSCCYS